MLHELTNNIFRMLQKSNGTSLVDISQLVAKALNKDLGNDLRRAPKPDEDETREKLFYKTAAKEVVKKHSEDLTLLTVTFINHDENDPYKDTLDVLVKNKSSKGTESLILMMSEMNNYKFYKTFYRDIAHLFRQNGLWNTQKKVLGINYNMEEVSGTFDKLYKWFMNSTEKNGQLYGFFDEA